MGVEVATSRVVDESHDGSMREVNERGGRVVGSHFPSWRDDKLVVLVFVMVAGDLLLLRSDGISRDVGVEESSSVSHVLERQLGSICRFYPSQHSSVSPQHGNTWIGLTEWVASEIVALEVSLEEGTHLRVSRSGSVEDEEVHLEAQCVDAEGDDDEAEHSGDDVADVGALRGRGGSQYIIQHGEDDPRRRQIEFWSKRTIAGQSE